MAKKDLPVYSIKKFQQFEETDEFYANNISRHLKEHHFILTPHKHDFYLVVLFTHGSGTHEIDFINYKVEPGSVFLLRPGQMHNWKLSKDIEGYVFFHTKEFYDSRSVTENIQDYPFFNSIHNPPLILLKNKSLEKIIGLFSEIKNEYEETNLLKTQKLHAQITVIYIELTRLYKIKQQTEKQSYLSKLRELEDLIDLNYKIIKYPFEYAAKMTMSEKHLNRICKTCLNKTTTDLITDRIVLEAKRLLTHSKLTISQVAEELGYLDNSYFTRLFKKKTGETPGEFVKRNR
ncbi:MAG: helix-turn-helix transcriptional regulator [Bacteroidia bacterium]